MSTYSPLLSMTHFFLVSSLLAFLCFSNLCFSFKPKHFNLSAVATHWGPAGATWYGSPDGAGSDGNGKLTVIYMCVFMCAYIYIYMCVERGYYIHFGY